MQTPLIDLWKEIHEFLGSGPPPGKGKRFEIGEIRFSMGMHRYYLEREIRFDEAMRKSIETIAEKYYLRLDERDPANLVLFDHDNEYIGRVQDTRLILMPQKMPEALFYDLLQLYVE
jgi:hypothetical protein